jgi:hypothetical protein
MVDDTLEYGSNWRDLQMIISVQLIWQNLIHAIEDEAKIEVALRSWEQKQRGAKISSHALQLYTEFFSDDMFLNSYIGAV